MSMSPTSWTKNVRPASARPCLQLRNRSRQVQRLYPVRQNLPGVALFPATVKKATYHRHTASASSAALVWKNAASAQSSRSKERSVPNPWRMVNIKINGMPLSVPQGSTILEAARYAGIHIPTLCYLKDINADRRLPDLYGRGQRRQKPGGRLCLPGQRGDGDLHQHPQGPGVPEDDLGADPLHPQQEMSFLRPLRRLRAAASLQGVRRDDENYFMGENEIYPIDDSAAHMVPRQLQVRPLPPLRPPPAPTCRISAVIGPNERGFKTHIGCAFENKLADVACISCGQCIVACPTGALYEKDQTADVWKALADPSKTCHCQHRSFHPCHPGRELRHAGRHQRQGQDGSRSPAAGLCRRL